VRELIRMTADFGRANSPCFAWWGITRHPQLATYHIAEGLWPIVHEQLPPRKSGDGAGTPWWNAPYMPGMLALHRAAEPSTADRNYHDPCG
jgi:hypothetical protein